MNAKEALGVMERVLENAKIAVLATVDPDGAPRLRWMTPALVRGRDGFLYAVTSPDFEKTTDLRVNPKADWMIQTKGLDKIVNVRGSIALLDNPAVHAEVLEAVGRNLTTFWRVNPDETKLIVLETAIEEISCLYPLNGERETARIGGTS